MKRLAIMQPYLFPYLGYYQLVKSVDEFIFLDDVNFIKGGYINRNSILMKGQAHRFSLPVRDMSSFRTIRDHSYLPGGEGKLLDQIQHAYSRAPYFFQVRELMQRVLKDESDSVASTNARSVTAVLGYLGIEMPCFFSSEVDPERRLAGSDRVIKLCKDRQGSIYINAPGGRTLYDPALFESNGLRLGFIQPRLSEYQQKSPAFVSGLSIIDALMWNDPEQVAGLLDEASIDFPSWNRSH